MMQKGYVKLVDDEDIFTAHFIDVELHDEGLKIRLYNQYNHSYECIAYAPGQWIKIRITEESNNAES